MKLIVGLGNPGKKYEKTRHNVGWLILDKIINNKQIITATKAGSRCGGITNKLNWKESKKAKAFYLRTEVANEEIEFLKPNTYMNNSGVAVAYARKKPPKLEPEDIIVIHDDKDIKLGKVKMQKNRSAAGHNGVQSIIDHLGTQDFVRIRVGVASDNPRRMEDASKFVLSKFGLLERGRLKMGIERAVEAIINVIARSETQ